jgi:hypothetical protein
VIVGAARIVGALTYVAVLALGPIVEQILLIAAPRRPLRAARATASTTTSSSLRRRVRSAR